MNAPFPNFAIAQRIFDRQIPNFTSQADRDEQIAKAAQSEEVRIYAELSLDKALLYKIADDIPGNISTEACVAMTLAALSGDFQKVGQIWLAQADEAVKREAEAVAINEVE
jgi:hypothetical protein